MKNIQHIISITLLAAMTVGTTYAQISPIPDDSTGLVLPPLEYLEVKKQSTLKGDVDISGQLNTEDIIASGNVGIVGQLQTEDILATRDVTISGQLQTEDIIANGNVQFRALIDPENPVDQWIRVDQDGNIKSNTIADLQNLLYGFDCQSFTVDGGYFPPSWTNPQNTPNLVTNECQEHTLVGINTQTPKRELDVNGSAIISGSVTIGDLIGDKITISDNKLDYEGNDDFMINSQTGNNVQFGASNKPVDVTTYGNSLTQGDLVVTGRGFISDNFNIGLSSQGTSKLNINAGSQNAVSINLNKTNDYGFGVTIDTENETTKALVINNKGEQKFLAYANGNLETQSINTQGNSILSGKIGVNTISSPAAAVEINQGSNVNEPLLSVRKNSTSSAFIVNDKGQVGIGVKDPNNVNTRLRIGDDRSFTVGTEQYGEYIGFNAEMEKTSDALNLVKLASGDGQYTGQKGGAIIFNDADGNLHFATAKTSSEYDQETVPFNAQVHVTKTGKLRLGAMANINGPDAAAKLHIQATNANENLLTVRNENGGELVSVKNDGLLRANTGLIVKGTNTSVFVVQNENGGELVSVKPDGILHANTGLIVKGTNTSVFVVQNVSGTPLFSVNKNGTTFADKFKAHEVTVDLGDFPDYVFEKEYDLKSLKEVEDYIQKNGHLPNIPSAEEVAKNGIGIGELQTKLLEKVEELTLYLLEQQKNIEAQQKEIETLKKVIGKRF